MSLTVSSALCGAFLSRCLIVPPRGVTMSRKHSPTQSAQSVRQVLTVDKNGYCESFNSKLRDELLAGEQFSTLYEAQVLIERWRRHYNAVRPHSSLGYRPPAPDTVLPPASGPAYAPLRPDQMLAGSGRVLT